MRLACVAAAVIVGVSACGGGTTGVSHEAPTPAVPGPTSDAAVAEFADWYRTAVEEDGDTVPSRLAESDPASGEATKGLIRILCALNASDTPRRHAAAESIKNDPEFFGDASFAASAIVQARIACGLAE